MYPARSHEPTRPPPGPDLGPVLSHPASGDAEWVSFLQWCLPRMGLRWEGYRKVRRQVCRRITRRLAELGLDHLAEYRDVLRVDPAEWTRLEAFCRITISRFLRDRVMFQSLTRFVFPGAAQALEESGDRRIRCWSAGCASGEEPYSLVLLWKYELAERYPDLELQVVASDVDPAMLERARRGRYPRSSVRELPGRWLQAFTEEGEGDELVLAEPSRQGVELLYQDVRHEQPWGRFSVILCRNLAFTYFAEATQRAVCERLGRLLLPGGFLVVGAHERLPRGIAGLQSTAFSCIYRKEAAGSLVASPPQPSLRPWMP